MQSPLKTSSPSSVSACGFLLSRGQSKTVREALVGPRERDLERSGQIAIRTAGKGLVQIVCLLR